MFPIFAAAVRKPSCSCETDGVLFIVCLLQGATVEVTLFSFNGVAFYDGDLADLLFILNILHL